MVRCVTDPRFCLNRSIKVRDDHSARLTLSLAHFFEIIEEYLTADNLKVLGRIKGLTSEYSTLPWFFYHLNKRLKDIIESDDVKALNTFFCELGQAPLEPKFLNFKLADLQTLPRFFSQLISEDIQNEAPKILKLKASKQEDLEKTDVYLEQAREILKNYSADAFGEVTTLLPQIITYDCPETVSSSSFNLFGIGFTHNAASAHTVMDYVFFYIHEAAHTFLFTLACDDPLVLNSFEERFSSPIRHDPRPMEGIFHAYFVAARFLMVLPDLKVKSWADDQNKKRAQELIEKLTYVYLESEKLIHQYGKLTPLAQELFNNTRDIIKQSDLLLKAVA